MNQTLLPTLQPNGTPPESRFTDAAQVKRIYTQLVNNYLTRSQVNAKVLGAIDGNPPISQAKLEAEGLGYVSNINWRLLEADITSAQNPYYLLYKDVPDYMLVEVDDSSLTPQRNEAVAGIISHEITRMLDAWDDFDYVMQLGIRNRSIEGHGNLCFFHRQDFRFSCPEIGNVYVDDEATQEMRKLPFLFIYEKWKVFDLYQKIQSDVAGDAGWNVEQVKEVIARCCSSAAGMTEWRKYEYWENKLRDRDIWLYTIDPTVKTAWAYCREFDGKITRVLITADQGGEDNDFLFRKLGEYDKWTQIIHPFFSEIGNGHWNGVKGLGVKCFNARDAQNRLKNKIMDGAMQGSSVMLEADTESASSDLQIMQQGPFTLVPKDLRVVPSTLGAQLQNPMMVSSMVEQDLRGNIGSMRGNLGDPSSVQPISAQEVQVQASNSNQIQLGEQTLWLSSLDKLYREIVDRVKDKPRMGNDDYPLEDWEEMVKNLHDRCSKLGVPESAWKNIIGVKAYRSVGRGSLLLKQQTSVQTYQLLRSDPNTPQEVTVRALRCVLAAFWGQEALNNIWPDKGPQSASQDASDAQTENAAMTLGVQPIYSDQQDSFVHAMVHLTFWSQQLNAVEQKQMDPAAYLKFAGPATAHVQQTLQAIQGDKTKGSQVQQLFNVFQKLQSQTKAISQQYTQQQQAAQAQQQAQQMAQLQAQAIGSMQDPKSVIQLARVQSEGKIHAAKAQNDMAIKQAKAQNDIAIQTGKAVQEGAVRDVTTASKIKNERKKTNAAITKPKPAPQS